MQQQSMAMFRNLYLEAGSGAKVVGTAQSEAVQFEGNRLVMSALVHNAQNLKPNTALTIRLQGSIPGGEWRNIKESDFLSTDFSVPGYLEDVGTTNLANWVYPWVRVEVELNAPASGFASMLLDVTLGFSDQ